MAYFSAPFSKWLLSVASGVIITLPHVSSRGHTSPDVGDR